MSDVAARLADEPNAFLECGYDEGFTLSREEIDAVHLAGARKRFEELRPQIAVLDTLAQEQGIKEIVDIDDAAPLLFPHTMYKSYPTSYIERNRFDRLTKWMQGMCTADLSNVNAEGVDSIDGWIDELDRSSELRIFHTSGTSGKLSFLPRTLSEWHDIMTLSRNCTRDWWGRDSGPDILGDEIPLIYPGYRKGASNAIRGMDIYCDMITNPEDRVLFLYPNARFSADVASLSGRLRVAEARGEVGALDLSPALLARRDEIAALEADRPNQLNQFFAAAQSRFGGRDIYLTAMWPILYDWAVAGLDRGYRQIFGAGSIALTGGGSKGTVLPDNWREQVFEFLGFDRMFEMFGCSETMEICLLCEHDHYHFPPTLIPYVLDPATGSPMPRKDPQHGRLALLDIMCRSYWAGIVTGDEVTILGWDETCPCGRTGAYLTRPIQRYSEQAGGDDKINCAGAPEAHDKALEFLANLAD
jgi:hypothetical protein